MSEPSAAELLADIDTAQHNLEQARAAVRDAIHVRTAAAERYRQAVEAFESWSKQALT